MNSAIIQLGSHSAKLNNFTLTFDEIDNLQEQIALIKAIAEYVAFKTDCANKSHILATLNSLTLARLQTKA